MTADKASREHRDAVTRLLRSTGLLKVPAEAPLVALLKTLAREMDEGGGTRTAAAYLSALKDVRRVLAGPAKKPKPAGKDSAEDEEAVVEVPVANDLAAFKQSRGIA